MRRYSVESGAGGRTPNRALRGRMCVSFELKFSAYATVALRGNQPFSCVPRKHAAQCRKSLELNRSTGSTFDYSPRPRINIISWSVGNRITVTIPNSTSPDFTETPCDINLVEYSSAPQLARLVWITCPG